MFRVDWPLITGPWPLHSAFGGEHFADAADHIALGLAEGEEFEAVAEALAVTNDGADFQGIGTERQGNFEGNDFSGFEFAGKGGADAILAKFGGASPAVAEFAILKHADLHAGVEGKARVTAGVRAGGRGRFSGSEFLAGGCHKSVASDQ